MGDMKLGDETWITILRALKSLLHLIHDPARQSLFSFIFPLLNQVSNSQLKCNGAQNRSRITLANGPRSTALSLSRFIEYSRPVITSIPTHIL